MHRFDITRCRRVVATVLVSCVFALGFTSNASAQKYRYFGTNLSDWAIFTFPSGGTLRWRVLKNENPSQAPGIFYDVPFGESVTDSVPNQGNWTGTAAHDMALYRDDTGTPANTYFIAEFNASQTTVTKQWGNFATDFVGAEGDYDGDGKMDYTVVRGAAGTPYEWWIMRSSDNTVQTLTYGLFDSDIPLPGADYDGNGTDDPALARIFGTGLIGWYWANTSGTQLGQVFWGNFNTDFIVPAGDYDGDGKADFMVWRGFGASVNGIWYLRTNAGATSYFRLGTVGGTGAFDFPLRSGDYDGDGKTDIAVYHRSNSTFYVNRSSGGGIQTQPLSISGNSNLPIATFGTY